MKSNPVRSPVPLYRDVDPVASALREMLGDRKSLKSMGEAGRRMMRERFAFSTVVDQIEQMYRSVAASRAGATTPPVCRATGRIHT